MICNIRLKNIVKVGVFSVTQVHRSWMLCMHCNHKYTHNNYNVYIQKDPQGKCHTTVELLAIKFLYRLSTFENIN